MLQLLVDIKDTVNTAVQSGVGKATDALIPESVRIIIGNRYFWFVIWIAAFCTLGRNLFGGPIGNWVGLFAGGSMRISTSFLPYTVVILAIVMLPSVSMADFFKYKDNSSNLIITNRFEDVPKKYRYRVKVVWDKDLAAKDPVARRSAAALEQYEKQGAARKVQQQAEDKKNQSNKGKTLIYELDDNTGQLIRRFE